MAEAIEPKYISPRSEGGKGFTIQWLNDGMGHSSVTKYRRSTAHQCLAVLVGPIKKWVTDLLQTVTVGKTIAFVFSD